MTNTVDDKVYIGCTTRPIVWIMSYHEKKAKRYPNSSMYEHFNFVGWHNVTAELIEEEEFENKEKARQKLRFWQYIYNADLNIITGPRRVMKNK